MRIVLRSLALLIAALLCGGLRASQDVIILAASPARPTSAMVFIDATHGWAINADPKIGSDVLATDDGGKTWMKRGALQGYFCHVLFFLNNLDGWALARRNTLDTTYIDTFVMRTHDGGKTWTKLAQVVDSRIHMNGTMMNDVLFVDARRGWIVGIKPAGEPTFLETFDGGASFSNVQIGLENGQFPDRILSDSGKTILVLGHNLSLASADHGASWQFLASRECYIIRYRDLGLWSGALLRDGHWLAVGNGRGPLVVSTSDYGEHWSVATDQLPPHFLTDVSFDDANHGCAVGNLPYLFCTSDGGATWNKGTTLPAPKPNPDPKIPFNPGVYMKIVLLPSGMGWVLTEGGYVYQTKDSGQTWAELDIYRTSIAESHESVPETAQDISTLKPIVMGQLLVPDGKTYLQLIAYKAPDGTGLESIHGAFPSAGEANAYLEKIAADAVRVVSRSETKNSKGEAVGERVEFRYYSGWDHIEHPSVIWTNGPMFFKVSSPSLQYVLRFERWENTLRPE